MNYKQLLFATVFFPYLATPQIKVDDSDSAMNNRTRIDKIVIESQMPPDYYEHILPNESHKDSAEIELSSIGYIGIDPEYIHVKAQILNNHAKWVLYSDKPLLLSSPFLGCSKIVIPGDSIHIIYNGGKPAFSGDGVAGWRLQHEIELLKSSLLQPTKNYLAVKSLEDYLNWNTYLNRQLELTMPLVQSYRDKVSPFLYERIIENTVIGIENQRIGAFGMLRFYGLGDSQFSKLTPLDLVAISDSTLNGPWAQWAASLSEVYGDIGYFYQRNEVKIYKRLSFDLKHDSIRNSTKRKFIYYNAIKQDFKGILRERLLQYIVGEIVKKESFANPLTEAILNDYYNQPNFPEYKLWMKENEIVTRRSRLRAGRPAPNFSLVDEEGRILTKSDFKGKIVLINFLSRYCSNKDQIMFSLNNVWEFFRDDPHVLFVSISMDGNEDYWAKEKREEKVTLNNLVRLSTGNQGVNHPVVKSYNILSGFGLFLLGTDGKIVKELMSNQVEDSGKAIIGLIKEKRLEAIMDLHATANDGPYVVYQDDDILCGYIKSSEGPNRTAKISKRRIEENKDLTFSVSTDDPSKEFVIQLKKELNDEPAIFQHVTRQLVISDIEGNFDALRRLLQSNGVIDDFFNWKFGDGHLILVGDMFDRGEQVTECLWLIYSLEDKAKEAGGYVHFILGNHEIMNMTGDLRYVQDKYIENAKLMGVNYIDLYNEKSELGKWLRTKNIVEKVGDILYVHAGISAGVNRLPLKIEEINNMARPYYSGGIDSSNQPLLTLFNSSRKNGATSPFWYRGYYGNLDNVGEIPTMAQIDSTLNKFNVKYIVTGHTIVRDTVSTWYENKIINVDTPHSKGKSEALLIEGQHYYRVNLDGKRKLLFSAD